MLKIQLNIFLIKSRKIKKNVQTTNYSIQKNFLKICVKFYVNCVKFYVNCVKFYVNFPIFAKINSISFELKFSSMKQLVFHFPLHFTFGQKIFNYSPKQKMTGQDKTWLKSNFTANHLTIETKWQFISRRLSWPPWTGYLVNNKLWPHVLISLHVRK